MSVGAETIAKKLFDLHNDLVVGQAKEHGHNHALSRMALELIGQDHTVSIPERLWPWLR